MAENEQKKLSGWRSLAAPGQEITVLLDIGADAPYKYTFVPVIKNEDGTTELNQDAIYNIVEVYGADANAVINGYRSNPNQPISTKHSKGNVVQTTPQTATAESATQEQPKSVDTNPNTTTSGQEDKAVSAKAEPQQTATSQTQTSDPFEEKDTLVIRRVSDGETISIPYDSNNPQELDSALAKVGFSLNGNNPHTFAGPDSLDIKDKHGNIVASVENFNEKTKSGDVVDKKTGEVIGHYSDSYGFTKSSGYDPLWDEYELLEGDYNIVKDKMPIADNSGGGYDRMRTQYYDPTSETGYITYREKVAKDKAREEEQQRRRLIPQVKSSLSKDTIRKYATGDTTASGQVNNVEPAKAEEPQTTQQQISSGSIDPATATVKSDVTTTTGAGEGKSKPIEQPAGKDTSEESQSPYGDGITREEEQRINEEILAGRLEEWANRSGATELVKSEQPKSGSVNPDTTALGQVNRVVPAKGDTVQTTPQTTTIPQEQPKSGSVNPDTAALQPTRPGENTDIIEQQTQSESEESELYPEQQSILNLARREVERNTPIASKVTTSPSKDTIRKYGTGDTTASGQVNRVVPAKAEEDKTEVESKPTEQSAGGGTTTNPVTTTAGEGEPKTTEQEPGERLGLAGQANVPTQPENSLAELYKMFNPEPPQRTPEEQAQFEKQRKASRIILGVADAINGLSNLGATIYGAPSREVVSMASKWSDAINAAEKQRKETHRIWREGLAKYTLEDIKHARETAQRKDDREAQLKDNKELAKYRAELDKSTREHAAEIKTAQDKAANEEWDRRAEVQQENELEQIQARGKQSQIEASIRAAASASNAAGKADAKRPTFAVTISGTPVDVALRKESDYSALFDLIKAEVEKNGDAESKSALAALILELKNAAGDNIKSAAHKKGYVMENFAKYYDQIKNNPMFKHLSIEFRDSAGNPVEFKTTVAKEKITWYND